MTKSEGGHSFSKLFLKSSPNAQICQDIAILAGDALLSKSFEHIARYTSKDVPAEMLIEVLVRFGEVGWLG